MSFKDNFPNTLKLFEEYKTNSLKEALNIMSRYKISDLIKGINVNLEEKESTLSIKINSTDIVDYADKGRKPGKMPKPILLKDWANKRNIPLTALYPIAKKIGKVGIKPKNFMKPFTENLSDLYKKIEESAKKDIEINLEKEITKK